MLKTKGRRERKREQTMDHLADTAWAMFAELGFDTVTMEAIADTADVAKLDGSACDTADSGGTSANVPCQECRLVHSQPAASESLSAPEAERNGCTIRSAIPQAKRHRENLHDIDQHRSGAGRVPHRSQC